MLVRELIEALQSLPKYCLDKHIVVETLDDFFDIEEIQDGDQISLMIDLDVQGFADEMEDLT